MKITLRLNEDEHAEIMITNDHNEDIYEGIGCLPDLGSISCCNMVLEIDNETGKILNWKPISKEELDGYLSDFDNDVSNE